MTEPVKVAGRLAFLTGPMLYDLTLFSLGLKRTVTENVTSANDARVDDT